MLVKVQREDFDVGAELEALTRGRPGVGGMASFLGLVRDIHGDARVGAMTLEHFPGMTERELQRIGQTRASLEELAGRLGFARPDELFAAVARDEARASATSALRAITSLTRALTLRSLK